MTNKETVRAFYDFIYQGKVDQALSECATTDLEWLVAIENSELNAEIPWTGIVHKGYDGFKELNEQLFGEFEAVLFEARDFFADGDTVIVFGTFKFEHRQTGKIADSDFAVRITMRDGKMARGHFFENTFGVAAARKQ